MKRLIFSTSLALSLLAGCAGAAPTPVPTVTPTPPPARPPAATPEPAHTATPTATLVPTPSPAATPAELSLPDADSLEPGRYYLEFSGYRFTFTVSDPGWIASVDFGAVFRGEDPELAIFWPGGEMTSLYRRACEWSGTEFDPGPSVDDLAAALASLEDFETTAPADVTVDGYTGKHVALTVPVGVDVGSADCWEGAFRRDPGRHYQAAGQTDEIYVLDLDGERQTIVVSHTPGTPNDVAAQLDAMLASLQITPTAQADAAGT